MGKGIDRFDVALRSIASADPRIAFFDDRAWFQGYWGGRDARGVPAYRNVTVGDMHVTNTSGEDPRTAVLADGHAGLGWNQDERQVGKRVESTCVTTWFT